jgi:hypothetical protein
VTVENEGPVDLFISQIYLSVSMTFTSSTVSESPLPRLRFSNSGCKFGMVIPAGSSCAIAVTYAPKGLGSESAALVIEDNAAGSRQFVQLSGSTTLVSQVSPVVPTPRASPHALLSRSPGKRTTARGATFRFAGNETATAFQCRLDAGRFHVCSSPVRYRRLAPGPHRFSVRALDGSGRLGRARIYRWTIVG